MPIFWSNFSEVSTFARDLAIRRGEDVEIRRLPTGWDIPSYTLRDLTDDYIRTNGEPEWEVECHFVSDEEYWGAPIRTGLQPPD